MEAARKAGPTKSWVCIVALTFLLPAGAGQLANALILAVTHSAAGMQTNDGGSIVTAEAVLRDCRTGVVEKAF